MSLPAYVINWEELEQILEDILSNVTIKDINDIVGMQKVKGFHQKIPALQGRYNVVFHRFPDNIIITGITLSQSAWKPDDYWDMYIGDEKIFDAIYTKEIASHKKWNVVTPITANTPIRIVLDNQSGNSRNIWVDIEYIKTGDIIEYN